MKKSTGVLLGLGVFFVIGCALLAFVMFPSAKEDVTTEVNKSFVAKSSTLNLNVDSLADITIYKTSSDKIKISGTLVDLNSEKLKTVQDGNDLSLTTTSTKMDKNKKFVTSTFNNITGSNSHGNLSIGIPTTIEKLHITTRNAEINNLSVDDFSVTQNKASQNGAIFISGLKAGTVTFAGEFNSLNMSDSSIDKIIATDLKGGDFSLSSNTFAKADFAGGSGRYSIGYNMGNLTFTDISSGNISVDNHTGNVGIIAASTDVSLGENIVGNVDVALTRSNISGYFNENPKNTYITVKVTTGELNIFGKASYGKPTNKYKWTLATTLGNIALSNGYMDDVDHADQNEAEDDMDDDDDDGDTTKVQESVTQQSTDTSATGSSEAKITESSVSPTVNSGTTTTSSSTTPAQ